MEKLFDTIKLISEMLIMKHEPEFKTGEGPYSCIDEDDGTSWNLYRGCDGVNYSYGALQSYQDLEVPIAS
jgi:hypothetical protein